MSGQHAAHVVTNERTYKGKVYRTHLLRHSYREEGRVKKETLANLTPLGDAIVHMVREALRGRVFVRVEDAFQIVGSRHHGHCAAVLRALGRLKVEALLGAHCRERQLVLAMIAARIIDPRSKLATANCFDNTTILELLGLSDVTEDDLYAAMDWLLERQGQVEKKLAKRHLKEGALALYDLSSSYFEGRTCPLAALGYSRDRKRGKLQVNYGLLTDRRGCPVAISAFKGNVTDTQTLQPQVDALRGRFGIADFVLVGDRGMITQKQVDLLRSDNLQWITALRPGAIRKLLADRSVTPELFDERNLVEVEHIAFPGERLMVCRNPALAKLRAATRESLIASTCQAIEKIQTMVASGKLSGAAKIGVRVGRDINKYKVAKHIVLDVTDAALIFSRNEAGIAEEAALDGLYVVRTSLPAEVMPRAEVVRSYKQLSQVERSFRSMKTMDLHVRPIFHRTESRVRAHLLLCMLAYYVRWHLLECWRPLLFCDEELDAKLTRDPVAPATRSASADEKAMTKRTSDGERAHSFRTLLENLGTVVRNTCRRSSAPDSEGTFTIDTRPSPLQQRAIDLIDTIHA